MSPEGPVRRPENSFFTAGSRVKTTPRAVQNRGSLLLSRLFVTRNMARLAIRDTAAIQIAAGQILVWAGLYYVFPALLLRWELSLGWSKTTLTGAVTLAIIVSGLCAPLAGRQVDRGRGPVMMVGCAIAGAICLFGLSMVTEIWQFYLGCGLIGLALSGCLYEPCFALVTRARGADARHSIIFITLIAGFAGSVSFPAAHALSELGDWRTAMRVFAVAVVLVGAPLLWFGARKLESEATGRNTEPEPSADKPAMPVNRWAFMGSAVFWPVAIGFALMAIVHGVTLHHLLSLLDERGIHREVAVLAAAFIGPMQVAGRLALFATGDSLSNHHITMGCFFLMGLSILILMPAGATVGLLVLFVILFGSSYGLVSIVRPMIARDLLGLKDFGAKFGALALFYLLGSGTAPFIGSLIWTLGGYSLVLPCLVVFACLGLGLYLLASRIAGRGL